jgi:hypothetical protein
VTPPRLICFSFPRATETRSHGGRHHEFVSPCLGVWHPTAQACAAGAPPEVARQRENGVKQHPAVLPRRSAGAKAGVVVAVGAFAVTLAWRFLTFTGFTNDHYAHLALAQQMLLGDLPIRDFSDPGWPLTYLISAAAWSVAGGTVGTEWAITATGFALGAACTAIAAYRLSASLVIASVVTALEILIYPRAYSYPKMLVYAAGAWAMLALAARPSGRRIVLVAALVTVAFLFRHDHGLFLGVASAVCLALASRADGWRIVGRRVAALTGAVAVFLLPWALFVALNGGLVGYFQDAIEFSRAEARATMLGSWPRFQLLQGRPLIGVGPPIRPLAQVEWTPDTTDAVRQTLESRHGLEYIRDGDGTRLYYVHNTAPENLRALADDDHVAGTAGLGRVSRPAWREALAVISPLRLESGLQAEENAVVWLFWLFWMLPVLGMAIACRRLVSPSQERWPGELSVVVALAIMATLVNASFLRDALDVRLPDAIAPAAVLGAWVLGVSWTGRWRRRALQLLVQVATLLALTLSVVAIDELSGVRRLYEYSGIGGGPSGMRRRATELTDLLSSSHRRAAPSRYSQALMPFFGYLDRCTSRSDRLIVTGEFPDVLVAAGRGFATEGAVFGAWYSSERHQDRTLARLRARPALFAVHMSAYDRFRARFGLIDSYLAEAYEPMVEIPVEGAATVQILVHGNRNSAGTDPETGWPCFR